MLFYTPAEAAVVKLVWFEMRRTEGRWRLELPEVFRRADAAAIRLRSRPGLDRDEANERIRSRFGWHFD